MFAKWNNKWVESRWWHNIKSRRMMFKLVLTSYSTLHSLCASKCEHSLCLSEADVHGSISLQSLAFHSIHLYSFWWIASEIALLTQISCLIVIVFFTFLFCFSHPVHIYLQPNHLFLWFLHLRTLCSLLYQLFTMVYLLHHNILWNNPFDKT